MAFVAPQFPSVTETFVYREALGLRARGWEVHPVSLHEVGPERRVASVDPAELTIYGAHVFSTLRMAASEILRHPRRSLATLGLALRDAIDPGEVTSLARRLKILGLGVLALGVAHWMRRTGIRHVHCHFANGPSTIGMYAAQQVGISFSFVGHANDLFDRRSLLRRKLERAGFVSCISRWHRNWYRGIHEGGGDRYELIRCGIDLDVWNPPPRTRERGTGLRVLSVGRLIEKKGVDTLIRALAESKSRYGLSWRLVVVGEGPLRAALESLARDLGCREAIEFRGTVGNEEVRALMAEADVFALPSRTDRLGDHDGIPVVLMEAMASGLPVVAGDLPAIRELVVDGNSGLLVSPDDVLGLAERLARLARSPDERERLARSGRERVEAEFRSDRNLDRLEAEIRKLILGDAS